MSTVGKDSIRSAEEFGHESDSSWARVVVADGSLETSFQTLCDEREAPERHFSTSASFHLRLEADLMTTLQYIL